jgi:hypothetical protein
MSCKSAIYTGNSASSVLTTGSTVPLGTTVRRFGNSLTQNGNSISITKYGYYEAFVSVTAAPTAAGTISIQMYLNGVPLSSATAAASVTTAGNSVNLCVPAVIRLYDDTAAALSIVLTGAATVTNVSLAVEKM